ncbi:DinB family protein [Nocardioides ginsengisoli]|uniref:DinB family protein n=1 Tax=Nocardioides ginsengisoli TaxID=363868 RepID=A0ABW3W7H8_9ACTN
MAGLESQREPVPRNDEGERDTTLAFLTFARHCVLKKVDGLTDDQLRQRLVVSDTTLLGLVQHLADGERYWFGHVVGGDPRWAGVDFSMMVPDHRTGAELVADYRAAIAESDRLLAGVGSWDDRVAAPPDDERRWSVRWVVAHMTGETTRHAGHADILREHIDQVTGR